jgi:hypothetical protein
VYKLYYSTTWRTIHIPSRSRPSSVPELLNWNKQDASNHSKEHPLPQPKDQPKGQDLLRNTASMQECHCQERVTQLYCPISTKWITKLLRTNPRSSQMDSWLEAPPAQLQIPRLLRHWRHTLQNGTDYHWIEPWRTKPGHMCSGSMWTHWQTNQDGQKDL